jgi:thioredoxin 2
MEEGMESIVVNCRNCGTKNRIRLDKQHLGPRCGKCGSSLDLQGFGAVVPLGDDSLDGFLRSTRQPILVDFYSPTCGPCQTLAPMLEELAKSYVGKVVIGKVDTSANPGCSAHFRIRAVPTLMFFKEGGKVDELVGLPDIKQLRGKLDYWSAN